MGINDTVLSHILTGEESVYSDHGGVFYDPKQDILCGKHNGMRLEEPVAGFRERFAKLKARDALLGAVLARLGADPGARETEAHNAVGRLLADREAVSKVADCYVGAAEKIAPGLGLSDTKPDELADQVLAMNTELSSARAKAQERHEVDMGAWVRLADAFSLGTSDPEKITAQLIAMDGELSSALSSSQAEVKALVEENAKLKAELGASAERQKRSDAALSSEMEARMQAEVELHDERISAKAEIKAIKVKLAEAELERMLAEATTDGMWTTLKIVERTLREKLRT